MSPTRRLWTYFVVYRWRYAFGVVCLVAATGLSLGIPWTVKLAIDGLGRAQGGRALAGHVGTILLLAGAHGVFRLGSRLTMIGAGQRVEHDVRRDLYAHLQRLPPAFYHHHLTGDLMSRATSDVTAVRALAGFGTVMMVGTTLTFAGTLTAMWLIDPQLTVAALAPFPLLIVLAKRFNHAVDRQSTAVQEQLGALSAKVQENLAGIAVVRAYTMERAEIERFGRLNEEFLARSARLARTQAGFTPMMGLIAGIGTLVVLWLGRTGGGGGADHPRCARRLQWLSRPPRLADDRARVDAGQSPPRRLGDGADRRDPGQRRARGGNRGSGPGMAAGGRGRRRSVGRRGGGPPRLPGSGELECAT